MLAYLPWGKPIDAFLTRTGSVAAKVNEGTVKPLTIRVGVSFGKSNKK
jgi:hypothetical protein